MNISDFEKHIHHTFHQQEVPLNTTEFANNLFARMDKKEKKYPFGWIFGALMIVILGLGGTYFYANSQMFSEDPKGMFGKNIAITETEVETKVKVEDKVEVENEADTEVKVENKVKDKVENKVEKKWSNNSLEYQNKSNTRMANRTTKATSATNYTVPTNPTTNEVKAEVKAEVKVENEVEAEVKVKVENEVKVEKKVEKKWSNNSLEYHDKSNTRMANKTTKSTSATNFTVPTNPTNYTVPTNQTTKEVQGMMFQLPVLARKDQSSLSTLYGFKPKRRKVECPTFQNKRKVLFFIQPEIGISSPIKSLEEKIIDNSEVTALRKENEKPLEGLHAALYAGVHLGRSPFYVKTGFAYSRLAERMDLSYNTTRMDTTFGIISVTQSQSGDTLTVIYGNIITERTVSGQKIKHYYHHLYDIPLCVGYQYPLTPRLMLGVEVGLVFNVGLRPKGEILTTPTEFAPVNPVLYERSLGLGWRAGLDVEYALTGKISLGLNARFNGFTRSFSNEIATYNQKYLVPGVFLYGKYYFRTLPIRH
jgi:hypothetical protein